MPRIWAIDWLRWFDVLIVVMGHCIRFLDDKESDVKLSKAGTNSYLNVIMLFGNMWSMSIFFFLAGAAANLSITSKTNMWVYFVKRVLRIGIPLAGGYVLAVLPYAYIVRDYLDCDENLVSDENISDSPIEFLRYFFSHCFSKHGFKWLWFLAMLALMTGIHLPIIFLLKRSMVCPPTDLTRQESLSRQLMLTGVVYCLGWGLFSTLALPLQSFLCIGGVLLYFTVTFGHVYILRVRKHDSSYVMLLFMMLSTHLFVQAESKAEVSTLAKWLFIIISYTNFFFSGFLVSLYEGRVAAAFQRKKGYLVLSLFNVALCPLLWPVYKGSADYEFVNGGVYATYPDRSMRILYGAGCYTWVMLIYAFSRKFLNQQFNPLAYEWLTRGTLPIYIIHPTIEYALAIYVYLPYGGHLSTGVTFTSMCSLTFFLCFLFYTLIDVTPLRFMVGLSGPSPLFPKGLFKPSPMFPYGIDVRRVYCGFRAGGEGSSDDGYDENKNKGGDNVVGTQNEDDEGSEGGGSPREKSNGGSKEASEGGELREGQSLPLVGSPSVGGGARSLVDGIVFGKFGLNEISRFDLIGQSLRHRRAGDEDFDVLESEALAGFYEAGVLSAAAAAGEDAADGTDNWAVPTVERWHSVLRENENLRRRMRELEKKCEELASEHVGGAYMANKKKSAESGTEMVELGAGTRV